MTPSNGTRIAAAIAAAALVLPGSALAAKHRAHPSKHRVRSSVSVPQPTIVVPHKYDAGGDGGELTKPAGVSTSGIVNVVGVAKALGNDVLAELGLPPLPV